jgi:shikimate dehydrogenase
MNAETEIYGVIGNPVRHSLSPVIHNGAFRRMGLNAVYLAFEVTNLAAAVNGMRGLGIRGMSVTIPHKTAILSLLDDLDEVAQNIGAVNTVAWRDGKLVGYNTDWQGALSALEEKTDLKGKRVMLLGAGGAARAIAFGLKQRKCRVSIFNRSLANAAKLAAELGFAHGRLDSIEAMDADILINATSIGMAPNNGESPLPKKILKPGMTVMDIVYNPLRTILLRDGEEMGCRTINGLDMLAHQGALQEEIWLGKKPDIVAIREDLRQALIEKTPATSDSSPASRLLSPRRTRRAQRKIR